jgi:hypothetical protein
MITTKTAKIIFFIKIILTDKNEKKMRELENLE